MWILLIAGVIHLALNKVISLPHAADPSRRCSDQGEYYDRKLDLCCSSCAPGFHVKNACTVSSDTICERCNVGTYMETLNHAKNCFKCKQCREDRGFIYIQTCSTSSDAVCACKPGTYCSLREREQCLECLEFSTCPPGQGVSEQGTDDSDISCAPCPGGTFSDNTSYTESCRQHTDCESQGRTSLTPGSATSDSICGPMVKIPTTTMPTTTTRTITTTRTPATPGPCTTKTQTAYRTFATTDTSAGPSSLGSKKPEQGDIVATIIWVMVPVSLLLVLTGILPVIIYRKRKGDTNNNNKKEANKPSAVLCHQDSFRPRPPERQSLLGEKDSSNSSISSSSFSCADPRSLADPELATQSFSPVIQSSQERNLCHESLQASNPGVTLKISATISCHLPPGTQLCSTPTSPVTDSNCNPSPNQDLPLSKEEEQPDPTKEAHAAVQESGKVVC
ncbi:hypothetical protein GJAV_G00188190 [Gymnothorax javanicus]|nr:hypothetical protein GJAV_G00188190 [Gymnothorax javanicus]